MTNFGRDRQPRPAPPLFQTRSRVCSSKPGPFYLSRPVLFCGRSTDAHVHRRQRGRGRGRAGRLLHICRHQVHPFAPEPPPGASTRCALEIYLITCRRPNHHHSVLRYSSERRHYRHRPHASVSHNQVSDPRIAATTRGLLHALALLAFFSGWLHDYQPAILSRRIVAARGSSLPFCQARTRKGRPTRRAKIRISTHVKI